MKRIRTLVVLSILASADVAPIPAQNVDPASAERGREAVRGRPPLNPSAASLASFRNIGKPRGPQPVRDSEEALWRDRYGLFAAPYENDGLPMGVHAAPGIFGKGTGVDCLMCHAGSVAGQTIIGLGNASLDIQSFLDDLVAAQGVPMPLPITFSHVRGTFEATAFGAALMNLRDAELNLRAPQGLSIKNDLCEDIPAWWHLKRKKTMYHTGGGHARSVRTMMPFALTPFNGGETVKKLEPLFADIQAYLLTLEPPPYPFPVDRKLAGRGHALFERACAKCHGTYGPGGSYPSKVIPLETIGTDRRLAEGVSPEVADHYGKSWLGRELGPDGKPFPRQTVRGYQAPPLDGVWASAPYFHNGSAPTVYHVLDSKARPTIFTRSYRTEKDDYDPEKVGWKITVCDGPPDAKLPGPERRKVYDTTRPGRGNGGHTFGDDLTDAERRAVIEYLKTL